VEPALIGLAGNVSASPRGFWYGPGLAGRHLKLLPVRLYTEGLAGGIAIIGILSALLLPALSAVRAGLRMVNRASRLRHFAFALPLYARDHHNRLPPNADGHLDAPGEKRVYAG